MKNTKLSLPVNELKSGMIAAEEFRYDDIMLLAPGTEITETIINKLKEKYIFEKIAIYSPIEIALDLKDTNKQKTVFEIDEDFTKYSFNLKEMFENIFVGGISGLEEVREFSKKIREMVQSTNSLIKDIVLKGSSNDTIYRHSVNVAALSAVLGKWIELGEGEINLLTYAGILHDFGKTKVNKEILDKEGPLTIKEFKEIKNHPIEGYNYIKRIPFLNKSVGYGVLMHHERLDGSGYPFGIKDDKVPSFARIIAITDTFDAINSNRSYKKSKDPFEALEIIQKESLGKLDYELCKIFIEHIINYYIGEKVMLNNNMLCSIVQVDVNNLACPLLSTEAGFIDLKKERNLKVEKLVL